MTRGARASMAAALIAAAAAVVPPRAAAASLQSSAADANLPVLTEPVNDFAHVIDPADAARMDGMIRQLQAATGDVVIVATVPTIEPYGDIREYANKLFENHGKGIGQKGKDNGLLIVLALKERRVQMEIGYSLEQWVTDGFAGETSRQYIAPQARQGNYGAGLRAGLERVIGRIAAGRGVSLQGVRSVPRPQSGSPLPFWIFFVLFIVIMIISRIGGGPGSGIRRAGLWGIGPWSGWSSGVGPFGGGFGGGGGGGFGGGFGGFGGGSSGGGGGGAGW